MYVYLGSIVNNLPQSLLATHFDLEILLTFQTDATVNKDSVSGHRKALPRSDRSAAHVGSGLLLFAWAPITSFLMARHK